MAKKRKKREADEERDEETQSEEKSEAEQSDDRGPRKGTRRSPRAKPSKRPSEKGADRDDAELEDSARNEDDSQRRKDEEKAPQEPAEPPEEEMEPDNQDAIASLEDMGARVVKNEKGRVHRIILYERHGNEVLQQIHGFPALKEVWTIGSRCTAEGVEMLEESLPEKVRLYK